MGESVQQGAGEDRWRVRNVDTGEWVDPRWHGVSGMVLLMLKMEFVEQMNLQHAPGTPHTVQFHGGVPQRYELVDAARNSR